MKKMIVSVLLAVGLVCSGAAFAVTKKSNLMTAWSVEPGSTAEFPIQFKQAGSEGTATIMFKFDYMCNSLDPDLCPKPNHVMVLFNGKPVFHGEDVAVSQTIFFNIQENGVLTIKSLDPEASVAYGQLTLSL